jgi:hypothetical protein
MQVLQCAGYFLTDVVDAGRDAVSITSSMHSAEGSSKEGAPCLNCGAPLRGAYCHACGQKGGGPLLHVHDFVHELVHEFLHFDSKILRTLKLLLFSPGALTRDYVEGRRVRYVTPVRLFLVCSVVLFGLLAFVKSEVVGDPDLRQADAEIALSEKVAEMEDNKVAATAIGVARKIIHDPEHVKGAILKALSKSFFVLVPLFAWVMWRFFAKDQPFYVAHMYFALHFHAFAFALLSFLTVLTLAHVSTTGVPQVVAGVAIIVYFYVALRRALAVSWAKALVRGTLVLIVCSAFNALVIGALFAGTLLYL